MIGQTPDPVTYYVYFLKSSRDGRYYIGCTGRSPIERLLEHNHGRVLSTKHRTPFRLVYFETFASRQDVFKREWHLKHPAGYQDKLRILRSLKPDDLGQ